jgi:flagellar hook protein FlgE
LNTNSDGLSVVGDNIANVNTVGFKEARANFQDMLAQTVHGGAGLSQIGRGSMLANVEQIFSQGALINTGSVTDLAVTGDGFFVVNGTVNGVAGDYYTRAGQFHIDADGYYERRLKCR